MFRWTHVIVDVVVIMTGSSDSSEMMSWSSVLASDPVYLAYFKEFLRLNEQRLITLHRGMSGLKLLKVTVNVLAKKSKIAKNRKNNLKQKKYANFARPCRQ